VGRLWHAPKLPTKGGLKFLSPIPREISNTPLRTLSDE
jgi:hypothetical protein